MPRVYLGLGANLGDREAAIRAAMDRLDAVPGIRVVRVSSLRDTAPVGGPAQPDYLNGVAELDCALPADALLALCKQCEQEAGRDFDAERNAARPLDLDVLLFGDDHIDTRDLIVPHPRMFDREFVLEPLRELGVDVDAHRRPPSPRVVETADELGAITRGWRAGGCVSSVVPTMGALHAGHVSLMERARIECDRVIATVFVNPMQFNDAKDFAAYPTDLERDVDICRDAGVDVVYAPRADTVYPEGFASRIAVGAEAEGMEGDCRAGHFEGVATVVAKLLVLAETDRAYFGEKDAQQLAVVRRLVLDLGIRTEIVGCPIVREADGLALSSRNVRLGPLDRAASLALFRALGAARAAFADGERSATALRDAAVEILTAEPRATLEYFELRREGDLRPLETDTLGPDGARALVAATFDGDSSAATRLIDNMSLVDARS